MASVALVIENATDVGSVAVVRGDEVAAAAEFNARDAVTGARTEGLGPAVARCLIQARVAAADLTSIVCGAGPGGFTSLRSAAAIAKGLCSALSIPLYAVPSLELLAWSTAMNEGYYVVAIAAGRGEWFGSLVHCSAIGVREVSPARLLGDHEMRDTASMRGAKLVGRGLDIDADPRARAAVMCMEQIQSMGPVSLEQWEPDYGRLAEAQVRWEAAHGRPLSA